MLHKASSQPLVVLLQCVLPAILYTLVVLVLTGCA